MMCIYRYTYRCTQLHITIHIHVRALAITFAYVHDQHVIFKYLKQYGQKYMEHIRKSK